MFVDLIYRILKNDGGRMMISDLVADREVDIDSDNLEKWCSCFDGALTKKSYLGVRSLYFQRRILVCMYYLQVTKTTQYT
jgi:hypothetical protein